MAKRFQLRQLDEETGELKEVHLQLSDYYKDKDIIILGKVNEDNEVLGKSIKILPRKTHKQKEEDHSYLPEPFRTAFEGNMQTINRQKKFTKVYQIEDPEFTKKPYYIYWFHVCRNLYRNCNIVINRKPTLHFIDNKKEFHEICDCSVPAIYRFMKECERKCLIATFETGGQKAFIVNPKYALNGNEFPNVLRDIFEAMEESNPHYDSEEEE